MNSSSGKYIKEDIEHFLEDGLALVLAPEPLTRARLCESVGLSILVVTPRSTSTDLSLENSSSTVRVSYVLDSKMD
jgi:hypothetical protein